MWTRDPFTDATWQTPPRPPFIRVPMDATGGDRIRITEDGIIRIIADDRATWSRGDFADAFWTKQPELAGTWSPATPAAASWTKE